MREGAFHGEETIHTERHPIHPPTVSGNRGRMGEPKSNRVEMEGGVRS